MANPRRGAFGREARVLPLLAVATLLAVLVLLPGATRAADVTSTTISPASTSGPIAGYVTWNGASILNYSSPTSAAHIGFNGVVDVDYYWVTRSAAGGLPTINDARLQIFYFGFALATRDVVNSAVGPSFAGNFTMDWSTGALQYILEGSYKLVASLLAPNGTTMWSQSFWVFVAAPFYIGALLPIVLILIVIWEVYNLATVGRQALLSKKPPTSPPESEPTASDTPPAETASASGSDTPPPSSGGTT